MELEVQPLYCELDDRRRANGQEDFKSATLSSYVWSSQGSYLQCIRFITRLFKAQAISQCIVASDSFHLWSRTSRL